MYFEMEVRTLAALVGPSLILAVDYSVAPGAKPEHVRKYVVCVVSSLGCNATIWYLPSPAGATDKRKHTTTLVRTQSRAVAFQEY